MDADEFLAIEDNFDDLNNLKKYESLGNESIYENEEGKEIPLTMNPVVNNLVACTQFDCEFDLYSIAQKVRNAEYQPRRFPAVIIHIAEPKATALIFKKGKMNIVGTKTKDDACSAGKKFEKVLKKLNYKVKLHELKITNIVASASCGFRVGLEAIASNSIFRYMVKYNPEIFSGLIFKIPDPQVTLLIFASGKIIFTGAKEKKDIDRAAEFILPVLQLHEIKMENQLESIQSKILNEKNEDEERKKKEVDELKEEKEAKKKSKHERRKVDPFFGKMPRT